MTDEEKRERERENKIRDVIEWIDNDLLRAAKYLLFLKEENEYLKIKVVGGYQIEKEELKAQVKDLCESLDIMNNREAELLEQIKKMKKDFSDALDSNYSNEALYNLWKKWELAE